MARGTVDREPLATYPPITAHWRFLISGIMPVEGVESVARIRTFLPAPEEPGVRPVIDPPFDAVCQVEPPLVEVSTRTVLPAPESDWSQVIMLPAIDVIAPMLVLGPIQVPLFACITPKLSN